MVRLILSTAFVLLIVLNLSSCEIFGANDDNDADYRFSYVAYDQNNQPVVRGWFTVKTDSLQKIDGDWDFQKVGSPQKIGPQTGRGTLSGAMKQDTVSINLNPQMIDNNVVLWGLKENKHISGTWQWVSFSGVTNEGHFEADAYNK